MKPTLFRQLCAPTRGRSGFTLEATLIYLVLLTALIGGGIASLMIMQRTAGVDYRGSRVSYAAEGSADHVMAQLATLITDGILTDAELGSITPPSVTGFTFGAPTATRMSSAVPKLINEGAFSGLFSLNQQIDIRTSAVDPNGNRSTVVVSVNAQSIPLFQFGVFYENDLEIHNGPRMDFEGWVHTNDNLYLTSDNTYFMGNVTTPDSVIWMRKPSNQRLNGVFINDENGDPFSLNFDSRSDPGHSFVSKSLARFDGRLMSGASGVKPLRLPLPEGVANTAMVDEKLPGDDASLQSVKFAWKADLHIVVDAEKLGSPAFCAEALELDRGPRPVPNLIDCALIFQGRPNAFWDGRENVGVDLLEVNMGALHDWIEDNPAPKPIDIIYITFKNQDDNLDRVYEVATTARDYAAVRLYNAVTLKFPMTIATDRPVYVRGHFNNAAGQWRPASILSDAITFLSANWNDVAHAWNPAWDNNPAVNHGGFPMTGAAPMQVYAAIAAGHSNSPCDVNRIAPACNPADSAAFYGTPLTGGAYPNYGGGLENFPRFLENWSGDNMLYRGSLVSLYFSRYAMRKRWSWDTYYNPPDRDWRFELRFQDPTQLPPGAPTVGSVIQTAFRPVY